MVKACWKSVIPARFISLAVITDTGDGVLQSLMCTRTRYYNRVQLVSFLGHIVAVTFFCLCIGTGGDDSSHKENCEKSFLYHILFYFI